MSTQQTPEELPELPTKSIVAEDYELSASDKPPLVTCKGITGLMLRYKVEDSLLDITQTEFNTILAELNAKSDTAI